MDDETKSLIGASIRTLLVGMPSIPAGPNPFAMVAQAWSEFEGHKFKQRVEEFITAIHARLASLESLQHDHLGRVLDLENQAALLEETVAAASREPAEGKRQAFADFYVAAITGRLGAEPDPIRSLLHCLEALTPSDMKMLLCFLRQGNCTGDALSSTWDPEWEEISGARNSNEKWDEKLGAVLLSLTKLETRGLIIETRRDTSFQYSGDAGSWYNQFRRKSWRITKPGRQLLQAISAN